MRSPALTAVLVVLLVAGADAAPKKKPDLRVTSLRAGASATAGGTVAAGFTVRNAGKKRAGPSTIALALSADGRRDATDAQLVTRSVKALAPGKQATGAVTATIPAATAAGGLFLIACADAARKVRESREGNNCSAAAPLAVGVGPVPTPTATAAPTATASATPTASPTATASPTPTASPTSTPTPCVPSTVNLRIISLHDFRGTLDPIDTPAVGGAAQLAAYFNNERAGNANTLIVGTGNGWGASQPLSEQFDHEPTVRALDLMGLDVDTFGSHNFDDGLVKLQTLVDLAGHTHTVSNINNLTVTGVAAPYVIRTVGGVKVAVIGVVSPTVPSAVPPGTLGAMTIANPVTAAQNAHAAAAADGAEVFIAATGMGFSGVDQQGAPVGPLRDFAAGVTGFDTILGGLTDRAVNTVIGGTPVVQARNAGRQFARIEFPADPCSGRTGVPVSTLVPAVSADVTPDPAVVSMLQPYRAQLAAKNDVKLATTSTQFVRNGTDERRQEMPLGSLVADAWRTAYGTQLALVPGGSIRQALPSSYVPSVTTFSRPAEGDPAPWDLLVGDAYAVFPFGNTLVTRTVTGSQLWDALDHGVSSVPAINGKFPQISGFSFAYTASAPAGARVSSVTLNGGTPILDNATTYTITLSSFTNSGGDGYSMFNDGAGTERDLDVEALADYLSFVGTVVAPATGRITQNP